MKFKEVLKELRTQNNLSQKQLADKLNLTARAISHYENGNSEPSFQILADMAKLFDVTVGYLLGLED